MKTIGILLLHHGSDWQISEFLFQDWLPPKLFVVKLKVEIWRGALAQ